MTNNNEVEWIPDSSNFYNADILNLYPPPWRMEWEKSHGRRGPKYRVVASNDKIVFENVDTWTGWPTAINRLLVESVNAMHNS